MSPDVTNWNRFHLCSLSRLRLARTMPVHHFDFAVAFISEQPSFSSCSDRNTSLIFRVADIIHVTHAMQEQEIAGFIRDVSASLQGAAVLAITVHG